jgi:hypothetical protein
MNRTGNFFAKMPTIGENTEYSRASPPNRYPIASFPIPI